MTAAAKTQWRKVTDQFRSNVLKVTDSMDDAEEDDVTNMGFPAAQWVKPNSTNPIERRDGEIKRRANVVGIFPNI
jgi:transposase-like protein